MRTPAYDVEHLLHENEELRKRLDDAEDVIEAIRGDRVDAFVIAHPEGERVLMLETADRPYRILVDKMQQGAVAIAEDGSILYCNERFCEMLKRRTEEVVGVPIHRFLGKSFQSDSWGWPGQENQGEFGLLSADGTLVPVHISVNPLQDTNAIVYLIVTDLTDQKARRRAEQLAERLERELTERSRIEEELRASEARLAEANRRTNEFLAVLAHELRNPLGPIRNSVHVLLREPPGPVHEEAQKIIERQVVHMARLTDDLLDVSRIAAGRILLRKERLDLTQLIREAVEDYRGTLDQARLQIELMLPEKPIWVGGDWTRLSQVVVNILHNAVKFTEPGGRVEISAAEMQDGRTASVTIRDDGAGMDPATLERVFDAFSLRSRTRDRTTEGLGIGMALARGLIDLHGGSIRATSDGPARGSQFTILLPLEREPEPSARPTLGTSAPPKPHRILVIEDNPDAADSLRILLSLMGHEVDTAYDGLTGIDAARRMKPEIVLCDIGLPGVVDGYVVAQKLREEFPRGSAFLVALTGYGQEDDQRRSHEAGFDFHVLKPADPVELERLLASLPA